jgi:hypothetical protein
MKHLQKFEAFLIPKPIRKFNPLWKDEDIALEILKELKSLKGNSEGIAKIMISGDFNYNFIFSGFKFEVKRSFTAIHSHKGRLKMNDKYLEVSSEICDQIYKVIESLKNTEHIEMEEDDKKDFRISRGLI